MRAFSAAAAAEPLIPVKQGVDCGGWFPQRYRIAVPGPGPATPSGAQDVLGQHFEAGGVADLEFAPLDRD